jgi:hypothetical protein
VRWIKRWWNHSSGYLFWGGHHVPLHDQLLVFSRLWERVNRSVTPEPASGVRVEMVELGEVPALEDTSSTALIPAAAFT